MNNDYMFEDEDNINNSYTYSYSYQEPEAPKPRLGTAIASMVLGIIAFVFFLFGLNIPLAILSIILGITFLAKRTKEGRGFAIAGICTAILSIVLFISSWVYIFSNINNILVLEDDVLDMFNYYEQSPISPSPFDDDIDWDNTL